MSSLVYPFSLPAISDLSVGQRDGMECVYCPPTQDGAMVPVGRIRGVMLFAHRACADEHRIEMEYPDS